MLSRGERNWGGYLAFPYNPYIYREKYGHSFTKRVIDMDYPLLMGHEFWDKMGGNGTYEEILVILNEVRQEIQPD